MSTTTLRAHLPAPPTAVFRALTTPEALARWRFPEGMSIAVGAFDARPGGAIRVSLTYEGAAGTGKTDARTDTYHGHFAEVVPDERVVEVLEFETDDPAMQGEMTVTFHLTPAGLGTDLLATHEGLPPGVAPADNDEGWRMALARLRALLEEG